MLETKFHTHTEPQEKLWFCIFCLIVEDQFSHPHKTAGKITEYCPNSSPVFSEFRDHVCPWFSSPLERRSIENVAAGKKPRPHHFHQPLNMWAKWRQTVLLHLTLRHPSVHDAEIGKVSTEVGNTGWST
jgi:hypothetical protein